MDANEYQAILGYLQTQEIPTDIKKDRYKRKNFIRKCKGICVQDEKLMKVTLIKVVFSLCNPILYLELEEEEWNFEIPQYSLRHRSQ